MIYTTGEIGGKNVITAMNMSGKKLWHRDTEWIGAFAAIGPPHANGAIPLIDQLMPNFDRATKARAYYALCRLRGAPGDLDGLVSVLESPDTDPTTRQAKDAAAYYLLMLGPAAKAAVPRVQQMLQEGKHEERVTNSLRGFIEKAGQ